MNSIYYSAGQVERFFPDLYIEELEYLDALLIVAKLLDYDLTKIICLDGSKEMNLYTMKTDIQMYYVKKEGRFKAFKYVTYDGLQDEIDVDKNGIIEGLKKVVTWL